MSWVGVLFLFTGPLWIALLHAAAHRVPRWRNVHRSLLFLGVAAAAVGLITLVLALAEGSRFWRSGTPLLFTLTVNALSAHLYFHVFNMSESSRRIRILLYLKLGRQPSETDYSASRIVQFRFDRLEKLHQFEERDDRLHSRPTLLLLASLVLKQQEKLLFPERFAANAVTRPADPEDG